jgi:hypothetical protein
MILPQLNSALSVFKDDVANLYRNHEKTFDLESFHGRFHIIRCLFLAECMYRFYESNSVAIYIEKSFFAILFHDSMREDNGIDKWELESAQLCYKYLRSKGYEPHFSSTTSSIILKANETNIEEQILYDVDVLDYNRFFFIPEEKHLFKDYKLKFAGPNDVSGCTDIDARNKIIQLAQDLVQYSETLLIETDTEQLIKQMVEHYLKIKPF